MRTCVFLLLLSTSIQSYAELRCDTVLQGIVELFKEERQYGGVSCIYERAGDEGQAILEIIVDEDDGNPRHYLNFSIVDFEGARVGVNMPEVRIMQKGKVQLLWHYPTGVEFMDFQLLVGELRAVHAGKTVKLSMISPGGEVLTLFLEVLNSSLEGIRFSNANPISIFERDNLVLGRHEKWWAVISADKSFFHSTPDSAAKTQQYLVKGDLVRVVDYRGGWLKVVYNAVSGQEFIKWIQFYDVL